MQRLDAADPDFATQLDQLLQVDAQALGDIETSVAAIIADVRQRGDAAIIDYTGRFDGISAATIDDLMISPEARRAALDTLPAQTLDAMQRSIARVKRYHEEQKRALGAGDWHYEDDDGNRLGQRIRGLERLGVYAPGGKAAYPSTVLMTVIPARVAGVEDITLVVPASAGEVNQEVLAAAELTGVDRVITMGGAQAVAALAYGTESITAVDKIVGPGNIYVATAKSMVFGKVGIDMIAGPSEVAIVADASANPEWLVMDMFAQAEHDEMAQAILISWDEALLAEVEQRVAKALSTMQRSSILEQSMARRAAVIKVSDPAQAAAVVNQIAPEHLELALDEPTMMLDAVKFAGAIFVGHHSAEVMGDYSAGPSHVLPTARTARFASPLGIYDFQIRSSVIACTARGAIPLARDAALLAEAEGLEAHAESAKYRFQG